MPSERQLVLFFYAGDMHMGGIMEILSASLARQGVEVRGCDLAATDPAAIAHTVVSNIDTLLCVACINMALFKFNSGGRYLHEAIPLPVVFVGVDPPSHALLNVPEFAVAAPSLGRNVGFTAVGRNEADYLKTLIPEHVPVAIWSGSRPAPRSVPDPDFETFLKRENAILMPINMGVYGSGFDAIWRFLQGEGAPVFRATRPLLERAIEEPDAMLDFLADPALKGAVAGMPFVQRNRVVLALLAAVKTGRRIRILSELMDFPFLLGAMDLPEDLRAKCAGKARPLTPTETYGLYRRYRFTLNVNGAMLDLMHDRVTNAITAGSVVLSDENPAMRAVFMPDRDYGRLRPGTGDIRATVERLMSDPEAAYRTTLSAAETMDASDFFDQGPRAFVDLVRGLWARL